MKYLKLIVFTILVAVCSKVQAQVSLSSPFTDHMVLQQRSNAPIWGWGAPGEKIKIIGSWSIKDTVAVTVNPSGCWKTEIKTPKAGGPYTLQVNGTSEIELTDVMIGEVWICGGQSNMEWSHLGSVSNKEEEIAAATHTNLRIFHVGKQGAKSLQNRCDATWEQCTPSSMKRTSAIGYYFARKLMQDMNVPVGIIVSAWGGTSAELWMPEDSTATHAVLKLNDIKEAYYRPNSFGELYNQMINPMASYKLAGAIWYQGESNIPVADTYALLMKKLINSWRTTFDKDLPFYFVQIAPFVYNNDPDSLPAVLREQQELAMKTIPNSGMVVINDLVDDIKNIHPKNKLDVGIRLANMAMAKSYGLPITSYQSPTYKSVEFKRDKAYISFYDIVTDLEIKGEHSVGFKIAGDDGEFVDASAIIDDGVVIVRAKGVKNPVAVRYCFDRATIGNVFTKEGLPLAPFRTDNRSAITL